MICYLAEVSPRIPIKNRLQLRRIARPVLVAALMAASLTSTGASQQNERSASPLEAYFNPFGDPWSRAEGNPDARMLGALPCRRTVPAAMMSFASDAYALAASTASELVLSECTELLAATDPIPPEYDAQGVKSFIDGFKRRFPARKLLGYHSFSVFSTGSPGYATLYKEHPDWFVRSEDRAGPDDFIRTRKGNLILDVTSPDFQDFIAGEVTASLGAYGLDGFLADEVFRSIQSLTDDTDVPERVLAGWEHGWLELLRKVNEAVGPHRIVIANVDEDQTDFASRILNASDGLFLEDPLGSVSLNLARSGKLKNFLMLNAAAEASGKYIINSANTNINGTTLLTAHRNEEHRYARYYFTAHLVFTSGPKSLLAYFTPSGAGEQYRSQTFFTDWNLRVGPPREAFEMVREGVFRRRFANAHVYVNNSNDPYRVVFGDCCSLLTPEGERVIEYVMPPKTGMIFGGGSIIKERE